MIGSEFSAVFYGLASAASWGAGDFSGGFATKRSSVYTVVIISQLVGLFFLIGVALLLAEPWPFPGDMLIGGIAGISGAIGLVALYRGLAVGRMGIVAPVAAVVTAVVPVIVSLFSEGLPSYRQVLGFVVALVAIWFISQTGRHTRIRWQDLSLPVVAGLGFGLFLTFIDRVTEGAVLWPLVAARAASVSLMLLMVVLMRHKTPLTAHHLPIIALAGILDTGGNAFFALATQSGRLDIAAVLASLYPATTVLLAWLILRERLLPQQWVGVVAALGAVVLIAA